MPLYDSSHAVVQETLAETTVNIYNRKIEQRGTEYHLKSDTIGAGSSDLRMTAGSSKAATITAVGGKDTTSSFSAVLNLEDGGSGDANFGVYSDGGPPTGFANGDGELAFGITGFYFDISERTILCSDSAVTSPADASSLFEFRTTVGGVLFPRMTTTQRNAISSPVDGLVLYNSTTNKLQVRSASTWVDLH